MSIASCNIAAISSDSNPALEMYEAHLVDCKPFVHIRVITRDHKLSVVEEMVHDTAICPATVFRKKSKRGVPMEERHCGTYPSGDEFGNNVVVVLHRSFVYGAVAKWEESWPRKAWTECCETVSWEI
jgi:hypothetical protein